MMLKRDAGSPSESLCYCCCMAAVLMHGQGDDALPTSRKLARTVRFARAVWRASVMHGRLRTVDELLARVPWLLRRITLDTVHDCVSESAAAAHGSMLEKRDEHTIRKLASLRGRLEAGQFMIVSTGRRGRFRHHMCGRLGHGDVYIVAHLGTAANPRYFGCSGDASAFLAEQAHIGSLATLTVLKKPPSVPGGCVI